MFIELSESYTIYEPQQEGFLLGDSRYENPEEILMFGRDPAPAFMFTVAMENAVSEVALELPSELMPLLNYLEDNYIWTD